MARYPLGIQTFEKIIEGGYLYVDKTDLIYKLVNEDTSYAFLSRPRRFGKSLLVSTLAAYFEGRKELFKGLAIEQLEKEWVKYPVLRFDMSGAKGKNINELQDYLNNQLDINEGIYEIRKFDTNPSDRFEKLIEKKSKENNQKVVILIDEYDAPLLDAIYDEKELEERRKVMQNFYSNLKRKDAYIKFGFITGITKFAQLSLFSELNNLKNISMLPEYMAICGITEEEMLTQMTEGISELAKKEEISYKQAVALLKDSYDGYHFTHPSPDIYNPFSLLNALSDRKVSDYWFSSGGTRLAIYALQKNQISPERLLKPFFVTPDQFDRPFERTDDFIPLLYQSGYLSIKGYEKDFNTYALSLPNNEVKNSMLRTLLPYYIKQDFTNTTPVEDIARGLRNDDLDSVFNTMKKVFASVPQTPNTNTEGHYQSMLCLIFTLAGQYVDAEVNTSNGRVDVVAKTQKKVYLFEIKLNKSAEKALEQIEKKDYAGKFALLNLPIVKIGLNFNLETRNIDEWIISEAN